MSSELDGVTKRTGQYYATNNFGRPLQAIHVFHKYSDNYKDKITWDNIPSGGNTPAAPARYHTGAFTTGRDWWLVAWLDDRNKFFMTDPKNGRAFFDALEKGTKAVLEGMREYVKQAKPKSDGEAAALLVGAICDMVFSPMLNSESTAGFKQHILRSEDEGRPTQIVIDSEGSKNVAFKSASGKSETGFTEASISELMKKVF